MKTGPYSIPVYLLYYIMYFTTFLFCDFFLSFFLIPLPTIPTHFYLYPRRSRVLVPPNVYPSRTIHTTQTTYQPIKYALFLREPKNKREEKNKNLSNDNNFRLFNFQKLNAQVIVPKLKKRVVFDFR